MRIHAYGFKETHGYRWFCNFGRSCFHVEFYWWHSFCHLGVDVDDEGWTWSAALPPLAIWISFDGFGLWKPKVQHIFHWDNNREVWLTDQRESQFSIHDWTIRCVPWGRRMEWRTSDPWWVRGVSVDLKDVALGRAKYTCVRLGPAVPVTIPMPEGDYTAIFTPQRQTWKRPRWFADVRDSFDIQIPKGIPFAGKGESEWDCDDDGLVGMSAEGTVDQAIAKVQQSVMERRQRHGQPSEESIREALE